MSDKPEALLKTAYHAVALIISQDLCESSEDPDGPIMFHRKVVQMMRMRDLKLSRLTVRSFMGCENVLHRGAQIDLGAHFDYWPEEHGDESAAFEHHNYFLSAVMFELAREDYLNGAASEEFDDAKWEQWEDRVKDCEVEDQLALSSFCKVDGDRWMIDRYS